MRRALHRGVLASAVALAAAACAPPLALRPPVTRLPPQYGAAQPPAGAVALDRWWVALGDAQLTALIDRALAQATDARLALARLTEARAVRRAALARFRVQGDVQGQAQVQRADQLSSSGSAADLPVSPGGAPIVDADTATAQLALSWEIDLFGRRAAAARGADADLAAARFLYEATRAALAADVADALYAAKGLTAQRDDAAATLRIQQQLRATVARRQGRGLAATDEIARIDADLGQAEAALAGLEAELHAARRALLVLTGAPAAPVTDLPTTGLLAEPPPPPSTLPGELLTRRPDVREADARLRSAIASAQTQRLELFPRFTLQPGVGLTAATGGLDYSIVNWTLGLGFVLPLLDRARLLAELDASSARAEQAAIQYERAVQTAFSEADQALVRLDGDRRRVAALAAGERRGDAAYAAARVRYARGLADLQTLLSAESAWRASRQATIAARVDLLRRTVTAFRALGGGWPSNGMETS